MLSTEQKLDIAVRVKNRILDPKSWTKNTHSRNAAGVDIPLAYGYLIKSCCWSGALSLETDIFWYDPVFQEMHAEFLKDVIVVMPEARWLAEFNDKKSHAQVMEMIQITIDRLKNNLTKLS